MGYRRLSFRQYFLQGYATCDKLASSGSDKLVPRGSNYVDWYIDQKGEYLGFVQYDDVDGLRRTSCLNLSSSGEPKNAFDNWVRAKRPPCMSLVSDIERSGRYHGKSK